MTTAFASCWLFSIKNANIHRKYFAFLFGYSDLRLIFNIRDYFRCFRKLEAYKFRTSTTKNQILSLFSLFLFTRAFLRLNYSFSLWLIFLSITRKYINMEKISSKISSYLDIFAIMLFKLSYFSLLLPELFWENLWIFSKISLSKK